MGLQNLTETKLHPRPHDPPPSPLSNNDFLKVYSCPNPTFFCVFHLLCFVFSALECACAATWRAELNYSCRVFSFCSPPPVHHRRLLFLVRIADDSVSRIIIK